jgi:hypothetical protein
LHRGRSQDLLLALVREHGPVDFFVHDSLHTYRNMRMEFEVVTPNLSTDALILADDVEGNSAFAEWVAHSSPAYAAVVQERSKHSLLGLAVVGGTCTGATVSALEGRGLENLAAQGSLRSASRGHAKR